MNCFHWEGKNLFFKTSSVNLHIDKDTVTAKPSAPVFATEVWIITKPIISYFSYLMECDLGNGPNSRLAWCCASACFSKH